MSWDDWNNFNNNDNEHQEHDNFNNNDENNDNLDSFLSDDHNDNSSDIHDNNDNTQQEETLSEDPQQDNHNVNNDFSHEEDEELHKDLEELSEDFYNVPGNTKNDPIFSEKDAYRIVNVTKVLEECDHDMNMMLQSTFGFNAKASIIKKAINIVQLSEEDFESRISSVAGLKSIYDAVNPEEGTDPLDIAIQAISRVSSMDDKDKGNMISLARKIAKEVDGVKNINIRRNQPAADIVSELRKSMTGEHNISDKVLYFNTLIETLKEAVE